MVLRPRALPDAAGYFGPYGGRFVPETLMAPLAELTRAYDKARRSRGFRRELTGLLNDFAGRPTPLYFASGSRRSWTARASSSSARTCSIPAPTRSTTPSASACSPA